MTRICFVVDSGTDVRLVDGLGERAQLRILARSIPGGRVISQPTRLPLEVEVGPAAHATFGAFVAGRLLALRNEIDVVLVQGHGPVAAVANVAGRLMRRRVVMLVCSPSEAYYRCRRSPDSNRPFRAIEYMAIRAFSWINARIGQGYIVLSPYLASIVRAHGGSAPVDVIPAYGVDRALFRPTAEAKAAIRARLDLPLDGPLAFFSSRVAPEKDAVTVLDALRILIDAGRPVRLLHLSGGHREFAALADARGVAAHVISRDAVPPFAPLADHYRATDVCIQASRAEGLGFSPLEALACGVPVVASAVGGLNDTIRDGETGWQVPAGDARAMASAIAAALDDPAEGARRAARGAAMVERTYERHLVFDALLARLGDSAARSASPLAAGATEGVYARKQLQSSASLVAWSHGRRFQVAVELASSARRKRVLDYGCGDGSFLAMLMANGSAPLTAVGAEIARDLVDDCSRRLGGLGLRFVDLPALDAMPDGAFDAIFCMEVLEHVTDVDAVLARLDRLLAPGGELVISVPVETGLPMVIKQAARRVAGWRGIGDYPGTESYRPAEWLPTLFAGSRQHIARRVLRNPDGTLFHDHKGFNWMALRARLAGRFRLRRVLSSPFTWLPPHLGTQAWFLLQKPAHR